MNFSKRSLIVFVVTVLGGVAIAVGQNNVQKEITFSKNVAPILYQHCAVCHHQNDIAPMSLLTYKEVRPWAAAIREAVVQGTMPPWHADSPAGKFLNDPRLSDTDIATIQAWVKQGAPEGNPNDLPPAPVYSSGWHIKPDVVFTIPETVVKAGNQDDYEYIYVPTHFTEDKWVQAAEVLPGDRRVVHHATVSVVSANKVPAMVADHATADEGVDKYHYRTGKVLHLRPDVLVLDDGCSAPEGGGFPGKPSGYLDVVPAIYLPGHLAETRPPGYALKIPAGSYLQFQIHYSNRLGVSVRDRTRIGLVFAKQPVKHEVAQYEIWNNLFRIPPNDANHRVTSCFTLPKDVIAVAFTAHMHFRGKSMITTAVFPDGHLKVLMKVPHYDFRWQQTYFLRHQFLLPKGTMIVSTAYFDNSINNPLNPDPSKTIRWGEPSNEEMMGFWLAFADPQLVNQRPPVSLAKTTGLSDSATATSAPEAKSREDDLSARGTAPREAGRVTR
ncbi:MAG TPA: thiol-disulfide isomerase [Terriglobia bacterium]|nr:thiol-disulfide isomerase [Terriglobia bacterium]